MSRRFNKITLLLPLFAAVLISVSVAWAGVAQPNLISIDILAVNDFHGALVMADKNPGAALLAGYIKADSARNPGATIILSAGDMFQGTPDSNLLYGKTVVEFMNAAGFDAMALGNHEFDWGLPVLKKRMADARFPFIAANILEKNTGRPANFIKQYVIVEKSGVKIGIVGIITPDTAVTTNPKNVEGLLIADPATILKNLIPEMRAQGAEIIVVLAHLASYSTEPGGQITGEAADLANAVPGIDVIVSGHSHQKVSGKANGVTIVQAGYSGRAVAEVHLAYARDIHQLLGSTSNVFDISSRNSVADLNVRKIVTRSQAEVAPVKNVVLGKACLEMPHDRYQLSPLGQWIADSMRKAAGADVALENGGGIRTGLKAGVITAGNLYEVMPFDNRLYRVELSGAQLRAALEFGIDNKTFGTIQFSGLKIKYDQSLPQGRRIVSAVLANGSELADDKYYTVAVNDFLIAGGDGFSMLKEARNATDLFVPLRDVLIDAVKKAGQIDFRADDRLMIIGAPAAAIRPAA